MQAERAGVVVPAVLDEDGELYPSLRFEPTLLRDLGDALLGAHLSSRPPWWTETDFNVESYQWPHRVDWATGAALLVSPSAVRAVGEWREDFFLYSEETDFCRRVRDAGLSVWFEPGARVTHVGEASGSSPELDALRAVNRVRYAELHHGPRRAIAARLVVLLSALVRAHRAPGHRRALHFLLRRRKWGTLPQATREGGTARDGEHS
jgi:GT2 family glycosyltransferase